MHTSRTDSGHAYKQSGPTFGFNGALCLELRILARALVDNRFYQGRYRQRNILQIVYSTSLVPKLRPPCRSMGRSAGLTNGVNEVVARRLQTAVQGRF